MSETKIYLTKKYKMAALPWAPKTYERGLWLVQIDHMTPKAGKHRHSVSGKGPYDCLESKWHPNTINT